MSFDAIRWSWTVPRLTPTQRLVLLAICDAANNSGECWPSQACLAEKTGLTDRSVRSALKALEERGLLSRKYRANNSGRTSDLITVGRPVNATERARCQKSNGQTTPIGRKRSSKLFVARFQRPSIMDPPESRTPAC
jgi:DNA-binding transcriptional MocR family regulator